MVLVIRPVTQMDLPELTDIYNHYVRETTVTFDVQPFTVEQRKAWLDGFAARGRYRCLVAQKSGAVIGWASSHPYNERAAYEATVSTSVYLAPGMTGQGIGRQLYAALLGALEKEDVHRAIGRITVPNEASVALHRALGFAPAGLYPQVGRKFGRFWDVATYLKAMPGSP
jgi:phosphinothricin acetyltransferase